MPTLIERGVTFLGDKMQSAAGRTVTVRRGIYTSANITAWHHTKQYQEVGEDGLITSISMEDWTFVASELIVNGTVIEPRPGDTIMETLNGQQIHYEVLPTETKRATEWLDTSGHLLLVHTKRVQ